MMTINRIREELAKPNVLDNAKISIPLARRGIKLVADDHIRDWFFFRLILARHLLGRDRTKDIEKAIEYMEEAQRRLTQKDQPRMWADACVLLGMAYDRRHNGDREGNVKRAIKEYKNALKVFSKDTYPELSAIISYSLGTTYALCEHGKRLDNIHKAIQNYRNALEVFTLDKDPERHKDIEGALTELKQEEVSIVKSK